MPGTIFSRFNGGTHSGFDEIEESAVALGQVPARIEVLVQPLESLVGSIISGSPQVVVYDAIGQPVTGVSVTVSGLAFASGTTTLVSDANGQLKFNDLTIDVTGTYSLTFTCDAYPAVSTTSSNFDVIDAIATLSINVEPQQTVAGQAIVGHPTITLTNSIGMPVEGVDVSVIINQLSFESGNTIQTTDASGQAIFDDLVINDVASGFQLILMPIILVYRILLLLRLVL